MKLVYPISLTTGGDSRGGYVVTAPDRTSPSPDIRGEHAELRFREFLVN